MDTHDKALNACTRTRGIAARTLERQTLSGGCSSAGVSYLNCTQSCAHAQLVLASQRGDDSARDPMFCDAGHFWFDDNGVPKMLSDGAIVAQTAPLEWGQYGTVDSVLASGGAASAISDHAAWILLADGRLVRFMDDATYGAYQGPAVLGTAPASATTGTGTSSSRPATLAPIVGIAHAPRVRFQ